MASRSTTGHVDRQRLRELLHALEAGLERPAALYLVGESSLVLAGWREWTDRVVYTTGAAGAGSVDRVARRRAEETGVAVERESPADVIPLPTGFAARARAVDDWRLPELVAGPPPVALRDHSSTPPPILPHVGGRDYCGRGLRPSRGGEEQRPRRRPRMSLRVLHFDPVSVALRLIARGDEPDYHVVLAFLDHGWIGVDEMDECLGEVLPRFSTRSIQQDPAEFRRKYKGLLQMWRARAAGAPGTDR